jgi:hypothetical protein
MCSFGGDVASVRRKKSLAGHLRSSELKFVQVRGAGEFLRK